LWDIVQDKESRQQESSPHAGAKVRVFSADGLRWTVRELQAPPFDRRGGTHLMFDGELIMRRIRTFPADWYELTDVALYALCDQSRS
jgi:hypothetical protein